MKNAVLALVAMALSLVSLNALAQKVSPISKHVVEADISEKSSANADRGG